MNVAMAALGATINVCGPSGERTIPILDFHRLPGDTPELDTVAEGRRADHFRRFAGRGFYAKHYTYLKLRDRASYAFALVSVAAALQMEDGTIAEARIALGGVAHKPWRLPAAEALLKGAVPSPEAFGKVADSLLEGAVAQIAEWLQDSTGAPRDRAGSEAGRRRHAAVGF